MIEILERSKKFVARPAANATPANWHNHLSQVLKQLGIHPGILIVVYNDMGLDSELGKLRQEPPQIGRFAGAEESDDENKRCHRIESILRL